MVANAMFDILSDENVINDIAKENPSLLEKIITAIKDFISDEFSVERGNLKGSQVQSFLKNNGYDGVIIVDENNKAVLINAFDSNQVKSATDNIGTFDSSNDDIREYRHAERSGADGKRRSRQ